jgi:hypothetical protein
MEDSFLDFAPRRIELPSQAPATGDMSVPILFFEAPLRAGLQ